MSRRWVHLCFFLSGFSGLVNEVVWSRLFAYTIGTSHHSIAVVVAVFMGGLALGSALGGPLADRARSPLRLYGWLVLLAGLLSALVAPLLWLAVPLLGMAYRLHDGEPNHPFFTAVKCAICAGSILVPTTLMGATLPVLARHTTRDLREVGARLGSLYAVNTFGAVAGAAAAGFYLIGRLGLGFSLALAAGLDVAVGAAVLLATRKSREPGTSPEARGGKPAAAAVGEAVRVPGSVRVAVAAFGVAGFANMCLQLGWTRALVLSIGNSTYAFSLIVGIFIFGLAVGGWIAGLWADRLKNPVAAFGWLLVATAVAAAATIPHLGLLPARFAWKLMDLARKEKGFDYLRFLLEGGWSVTLLILPSTVLMGMAFPMAGRLRALSPAAVGRAVGDAYAANTAGAILGTALTGFILIPLLGRTWAILYLAVGLGLLGGVTVLIFAPRRGRVRFAILGLVLAVIFGWSYDTRPHGVLDPGSEERIYWHPVIFSQGAYVGFLNARRFKDPEEYARNQTYYYESLYYRDGEAGTVAVLKPRIGDHLMLNISGKTDASAGELSFDTQTQILLGHLPLLFHPRPRQVLTLGLGGGMTVGAMTLHPEVEEIDCLEISPEVEEAARLWFADANHHALENPKVRTIIGDGRNHLTHTARTYDVISSEPSNFWIAGLGNLFTEEFYRLAERRLNPGGIVCQWMYGYGIRLEDYQTALRTFLRVFPYAMIWSNSYADTILLGSKEPIEFDRQKIAAGLSDPKVKAQLIPIGISEPEDLFRYFLWAKRPEVRPEVERLISWVGEGQTNRDFFPVLEFSSPLGFYDNNPEVNPTLAEIAGDLPLPLFRGFDAKGLEVMKARRQEGRTLNRFFLKLYSAAYPKVIEEYALLAREGSAWSLDYASQELLRILPLAGEKGREVLRQARKVFDTADLCAADDLLPGSTGDPLKELEAFRALVHAAPQQRWQAYLMLARVEGRAGRAADGLKSVEAARERGAPVYQHLLVKGLLVGLSGDYAAAEVLLRESLASAPRARAAERGEAAWNLGYCLEERGLLEPAAGAYRQAKELGHDPVGSGIAIASCLRRLGKLEEAIREAQAVLPEADRLSRHQAAVRAELARCLAARGKRQEALQWMEAAAKLSASFATELEELRTR